MTTRLNFACRTDRSFFHVTMHTLEALRELFAHMEWADATVWRAALACPAAAQDARFRDVFLHLHVVQRAFLHVWTTRPLAFPSATDFPGLTAIRQWGEPVYDELRVFLSTVDEARLSERVVMPWLAQFEKTLQRTLEAPTLAETVFQVTSHSTYHRGQLNARLRELGGEPPLVDYIAWVWFGKPAPEWAAS